MRHARPRIRAGGPIAILSGTALLAACVGSPPQPSLSADPRFVSADEPFTVASRITEGVRDCWFGARRPAFESLFFAPELNSYSGRPRVLIVPADNPGGLPLLVIEASAQGGWTGVQVFGPLLSTPEGPRIARDVARWTQGGSSCA